MGYKIKIILDLTKGNLIAHGQFKHIGKGIYEELVKRFSKAGEVKITIEEEEYK
jgi:hypothetical protein